jgi:predicted enzyme related to lactoylglutathione lyase
MPETTTHAPGSFCWIDLGTPDQDAAGDFYGALFGWTLKEDENAEQTGGYRTAQLSGNAVGGVMKLTMEGQPPAWLNYVCVEDADATVSKARQAGAVVHAEPMSVLDYGRMAVLADPTGAAFGIWQPGIHSGADVVGEPGAMSWNELNTRDPEAAKAFYADLFGWSFEEKEFQGSGTYTIISLNGKGIGGLSNIAGRVPAEVPAHWLVYFAVDDADAAVATTKERGGDVFVGPMDVVEVGRLAVLKDPWGAIFAVIQPDAAM